MKCVVVAAGEAVGPSCYTTNGLHDRLHWPVRPHRDSASSQQTATRGSRVLHAVGIACPGGTQSALTSSRHSRHVEAQHTTANLWVMSGLHSAPRYLRIRQRDHGTCETIGRQMPQGLICDILDFDKGRSIKVEDVHSMSILVGML